MRDSSGSGSDAGRLRLGGLTPLSTTDYPGRLSAVLFLQGCGWACVYCHNQHLRPAGTAPAASWADAKAFLRRRVGLLDAVVFSGGEPTLQDALPAAMAEVRALGFRVGLHTAGPSPERLAAALPHADWVGFDVKAPFGDYERITEVPGSGEKAKASLRLLIDSGVDHECRTTVHPDLFRPRELSTLSAELLEMGARRHVLQGFRPDGCRDAALRGGAGPGLVDRFLERALALAPWLSARRPSGDVISSARETPAP